MYGLVVKVTTKMSSKLSELDMICLLSLSLSPHFISSQMKVAVGYYSLSDKIEFLLDHRSINILTPPPQKKKKTKNPEEAQKEMIIESQNKITKFKSNIFFLIFSIADLVLVIWKEQNYFH